MEPVTKSIMDASMLRIVRETQSTLAQLIEMHDLQTNYTLRLLGSLRSLQAFIKDTIPVDPNKLGCPYHNIKEAYLLPEAQILMIREDGKIASESLTSLEPAKVLAVLEECLPAINQIIAAKKQMVEERVELLEQLVKEFKKINETLNPVDESNLAEDVVQKALSEA
ncbi:MAG: hypothetical protein QXN08_04390 [Nitrososphaerales archaeon]